MSMMEVGVRIPSAGLKTSPENVVTVARWAEQLGYHSIWASDHVVLPEHVEAPYPYTPDNRWPYSAETPWFDPLLALAWAGAAAPTLKLGTSVMVIPLRNPVLLAKQLATLDSLSRGRVILGAGAGWMEEEFDLVGVPFPERGRRAAEMVKLMRALWTGETVNFQGEYWEIAGAQMHPTPVQPTIPVVWGGHSAATLRRVARVGDGWHPTQITLDQLREGIARLRHYCAQEGRDPDSVLVIARPGGVYPITAETLEQQRELGIQHLVVDPPLTGADLSACREELERVAELCNLQPRSQSGRAATAEPH